MALVCRNPARQFRCFLSISHLFETMKSSNKDEASPEHDDEDAAVFIYDRRAGSRPQEKIQLGGIFNFVTFREKTRQVRRSVCNRCIHGAN